MATKRRKIPPRRIGQPVPPWAQRLLAGERPAPGSEDEHGYVGWLFFGDQVPGLPDPLSEEGLPLWQRNARSGRRSEPA